MVKTRLELPAPEDRRIKRERMVKLLDARGLYSISLTQASSVAWYLDGARSHVNLAAPSIVAVEVSRDGDRVHVTSNEEARLLAEELPVGIEVVVRDWWAPVALTGVSELHYAADLRAVRRDLLPSESVRFAALGKWAATAVTDAVADTRPDETERALAARISAGVVANGGDPLVVLVAGASRLAHRHPLPTAELIGRRAMVILCARRWGLVANLTRWVRFGPALAAEEDADERLLQVEAAAFAATMEARPVSDALLEIAAAYPRHGFGEHEWRRHHQGGPAGYDGRDPRAVPDLPDVFAARAHVAWNPSAPGVKLEDTVVIDRGVVQPLTVDTRWPVTIVNGVARPATLQLD